MGHPNVWNSHPKNYGPGSRTCHVCGNSHGLNRKYGLMACRQCFCHNAEETGFVKDANTHPFTGTQCSWFQDVLLEPAKPGQRNLSFLKERI